MSISLILVFLHVCSAIGIFSFWSVEYSLLKRLENAESIAKCKVYLGQLKKQGTMAMVSMLVSLITGIVLMVMNWGPRAWMTMALISILILIIIGVSFAKYTMPKIRRSFIDETSQGITGLRKSVASLFFSVKLRLATGIGIIALMTIKPQNIWYAIVVVILALLTGSIWIYSSRLAKS